MNYYLIAGEASGDLHGSNLMRGLRQADSAAQFRFWGGDLMAAQGDGNLVKHYKDTAVMGFLEVLSKLRTVLRNIRFCKKDILAHRPDVLILIDYPGFNLRMAKFAKQHGIKVFYYIAPKVWAWKEKRVHRLKKYVDKLFIIFPFEVDYFKRWNIDACYAGNPLVDSIGERLAQKETFHTFIERNKLPDKPVVAVLPGSRMMEINYVLPRILFLAKQFPDYRFVVAGAPSIDEAQYKKYLHNDLFSIVYNQTCELLAQATAAIVASGTATLEAALIGVPQVVCYGGNEISYQVAKRLVRTKYISLVNLIMDAPVVTELIQHDMNEKNLQSELSAILPGGAKRPTVLAQYDQLRAMMGERGASQRVAKLMCNVTN
ncbi:MAG: lipid-A-disaccharide synthase [Prevotellaceae bacterium]|jgi:lipid-A-disaccharide synthase|nr:lipid-A-disaccharide synthase [Prevotellaceae bacterium]